MRRLVFTGDGSSKFWEGGVKGATLEVKFGRIGAAGQSKTKKLASPKAAQAELEKLVREKLAKGYRDDKPVKVSAPAPVEKRAARSGAKVDATIPDVNLRLAIVQALTDAKVLPELDRKKFLANEKVDPLLDLEDGDQDIEYTKVLPIQKALVAQLQSKHLPQIKKIWWEGGLDVQHLIWSQWDGEGGEFDVESLEGIDACTSLETFSLAWCTKVKDASPLGGVKTLEVVSVAGSDVTDVRALAGLPKLREIDLSYNRQLVDMTPFAGHATLEKIDIARTGVIDLSFAMDLPALKKLRVTKWGPESATAKANTKVVNALKKRKVAVDVR
jgi:predicted DNA-binding WGR domain protein